MKKLSAFILLMSLLVQHSGYLANIVCYEINKDYVAANLCENRAKPRSCCKGKCYLKKQQEKSQSEELPASGNFQKLKVEGFFTVNSNDPIPGPGFRLLHKKRHFHQNDLHTLDRWLGIFRPPRNIASC